MSYPWTRRINQGVERIQSSVIPSVSPYTIQLERLPWKTIPSSVHISGFTEIFRGTPNINEFLVNYETGIITFNANNAGQNVTINYKDYGDKIVAEDINTLQQFSEDHTHTGGTDGKQITHSSLTGRNDANQHNIDSITNLQNILNNKSNIDHTHDDRYYTELETNDLLNNKSNIDHTHEGNLLKSTGQSANKILETDGSGGFRYIPTPSGSGGGNLGSNIYVVAEEGGHFSDIRTALDSVESNDILLINPKDSNWNLTYNFTVQKKYSLKGYGIWDSVIYPEQNQNSVFIASGWDKPSLLLLSSLRLNGNLAIDIDIFGFTLLRIDSCSIAGIKFHTGYGSHVEIYNSEISYTDNFSALDLKVKGYGSATNVEIRNSVFSLGKRSIEVSCDGPCRMILINTYFFASDDANYVINKTGQYDLDVYVSNCATNANYLVNLDSEGTVNIYDCTL